MDKEIKNVQDALTVMAHFLETAQSRGVFSLAEASKIWEAFRMFQKSTASTEDSTTESQSV